MPSDVAYHLTSARTASYVAIPCSSRSSGTSAAVVVVIQCAVSRTLPPETRRLACTLASHADTILAQWSRLLCAVRYGSATLAA